MESGVISFVMGGAEPPFDSSCPILDPTASIQISSELIGIYQSRIDALINQLGKNVTLEFTPNKEDCPNCIFDSMNNRSSGRYQSGGPRPFNDGGKCPYCKGVGILNTPVTKCIKCLIKWNPEDAPRYGVNLQNPAAIVRLKTFLTDADDLSRCISVVLNKDISATMFFRAEKVRGPIPVGLREDRYCISFWKLVENQ